MRGVAWPHKFTRRLQVNAVEDSGRPETVPQAIQLGVLGYGRGLADPPQPLGQADAVPGRLAVGQEDVLARLVQSPDEDQQLEDDGVNRYAPGLAGFLAGLVAAEHRLAGVEVQILPLESRGFSRPAAGEAQEGEYLAEAGGG
jgi:hypothetical protein